MTPEITLGLAFLGLMLVWIAVAVIVQRPPSEPEIPSSAPNPSDDWIQSTYSEVSALYIEVDREIWQVSTIFNAGSLVVLGWVVTKIRDLPLAIVVVAGCASFLLVTVATLFKHRLRNFNIVHIQHLRTLESVGSSPGDPRFWGLHHRRRILKTRGPLTWLTSIHGVMDLYAIAFALLWVALWLCRGFLL